MSADIRELLPLYALGTLEPDEASAVERAIATDPALAAELDGYLDLIPRVQPGADVKARLLASVGGGRFEKLADQMAKIFEVTLDRARELLGLLESAAAWEHPMPGIDAIHFDGGPALAAADCGFVRIAPGCTFPWHTHRGEEVTLVLAGVMRDHAGNVSRAGDIVVLPGASQHDLTAVGNEDVIYAARVMNGFELSPRT